MLAPPIDIQVNKCGHYMEIKGRSTEFGGDRVIEEEFNLKHSNNLTVKKWSIYRGGRIWEFDCILIILFII